MQGVWPLTLQEVSDFSLTFIKIKFFPDLKLKFLNFSQTFARSGISLTFSSQLDNLLQFLPNLFLLSLLDLLLVKSILCDPFY